MATTTGHRRPPGTGVDQPTAGATVDQPTAAAQSAEDAVGDYSHTAPTHVYCGNVAGILLLFTTSIRHRR